MNVTQSGGYVIPQYEEESLFKPVGKQEMDNQDFMNLFIAQLQHQDPMEPMSTEAMAGQLAEMSNMDSLQSMTKSMDKLLEYQTSQNNLQLLSLLDTNVKVAGNTIGVSEGQPGEGEFLLDENATTCTVKIYDAGGHLIDVMDIGPSDAGLYELDWDGTDMQDNEVDDGAYSYEVEGYNAVGDPVDVDYRTIGMVTGVSFENGLALINIDKYVAADVGSVMSVLDEAEEQLAD